MYVNIQNSDYRFSITKTRFDLSKRLFGDLRINFVGVIFVS